MTVKHPLWTIVTIRTGRGVVAQTTALYQACERPCATARLDVDGHPTVWLRELGREGET